MTTTQIGERAAGLTAEAAWAECPRGDLLTSKSTRILDEMTGLWRCAPRRWGHPLHSLCAYFAMFPPHIPRVFIEWLTVPSDVFYDPFCGRGTAPMEACRLGRVGLGSDANPLAHVLAGAKVEPPTIEAVLSRLQSLEHAQSRRCPTRVPDEIRMLYAPVVLRQLCFLQKRLNVQEPTDRFIMATLLGLLHANYRPGGPARGLSISMPNTFSMSPTYVRGFIAEHRLEPPNVDVFDMLRRKVLRMSIPDAFAQRGRIWQADARSPVSFPEGRAKLIFTSPPYLGVIKYGKYNWIRLWMLGHAPKEVDNQLIATTSLRRYLEFMESLLQGLQTALRPDGYLCLMIGDVRDRSSDTDHNLANTLWSGVANVAGWRLLGILNDHLPQQHKVSRIWGSEKRGQATKVDRILVLAPPGSSHELPPQPRELDWRSPQCWAPATVRRGL